MNSWTLVILWSYEKIRYEGVNGGANHHLKLGQWPLLYYSKFWAQTNEFKKRLCFIVNCHPLVHKILKKGVSPFSFSPSLYMNARWWNKLFLITGTNGNKVHKISDFFVLCHPFVPKILKQEVAPSSFLYRGDNDLCYIIRNTGEKYEK
jgi:hypothetical protein